MPELEAIPDQDCVQLLRSHQVGRIALLDAERHPLIFPVNYFFDEGVVVFRTDPGTKLDLAPGAHVSFEIDGWEPERGAGWSVVVNGICHDITAPDDARSRRMHYWPVEPVAPGAKEHWIGIWANHISGRRFGPPAI
ncbi:MAG TPA: pyridoxamine 5'-phosphate oxidase family protein [Candidatus Dormibacteraeota bacterium]|nr:pyridoxamine 5'-phosphate oxidase family protein [Candidatus Dormibacteraeota bacterium]